MGYDEDKKWDKQMTNRTISAIKDLGYHYFRMQQGCRIFDKEILINHKKEYICISYCSCHMRNYNEFSDNITLIGRNINTDEEFKKYCIIYKHFREDYKKLEKFLIIKGEQLNESI